MTLFSAIDSSGRTGLRLVERALVAGEWLDAASHTEVLNPATGKPIGRVPRLGVEAMRQATAAAKAAFPAWRALTPRARGDLLMAWRERVLTELEPLAAVVTAEQGKPLADARGEIRYGAEFLRWFAEEAGRAYGEIIPSHLPGRKLMVQREPVGVAGLVTPWNFPFAMLARKAGAALAAGCPAVCVPSMEAPFSALALARLGEEAGLPAGVLSVLTGDPGALVGALCASPDVRAVSFTGSTRVGRLIALQCAPTFKRVSLELGGHAPFIVFADADVEAAASAAIAAKFQTSGQDCLAANRIFVQRPIYESFVAAFARGAAALTAGEGADPCAQFGPLIHRGVFQTCADQVADALAAGARLVLGGAPSAPTSSLFFPPTVLADVPPEAKIMHEETFGPVAAIVPFDDEAEVIARANDTEYGLAAYVFTRDLSRAHRCADLLEYGMVGLNAVQITGAPIPFGGVKSSGLGREGSRHGLEAFTELKYVCVAL
jgi:succinate-semialdehyde dehydrogenase